MASIISSQIISKVIVKPSSPTPPHHKTFHLSLQDRHTISEYVSFAFFFNAPSKTCDVLSDLKSSLSTTLAKYYPFAGRLTHNRATIDCNDEGIEFFEGQMQCKLYEILKNPEDEILNQLFPRYFLWSKITESTSLLAVQVTSFECGGIAVGVCISHKIADGFSMATFINDWAKVSRGERICGPEFIAMSMQPKQEISVKEHEHDKVNCVTERFVFGSSSLSHLKDNCTSLGLTDPTRVESVTALLYKTAMSAARSQSGLSCNSFLHQIVNLRSKACNLPFLENSVGNFIWCFAIFTGNDSEKKLNELTRQLREEKMKIERVRFDDWFSGLIRVVEMGKVCPSDINIYTCSSLCMFPFYEVDYGWGKPLWVRMASTKGKNAFILMDSKDGQGIEALVTLGKDDMEIFKLDKELLTFASLNPSVV